MLTQWFHPEPNFKGLPLAVELYRRGHEVEVLTGFPNYPSGKVYDGYSIKLWQRETLEGIKINRVALYPSHNSSGILRILNYLSFSFMTLLVGPWIIQNKPDVVYVYNLATLSRTASFLRWLYGCKIVYDVQDLWPDSITSSGMVPDLGRFNIFFDKWSLKAYQRADFLIVQSPGFQKILNKRGIEGQKIKIVYNWSLEETTKNELTDTDLGKIMRPKHGNTYNVVYAGTMGPMQGLETILESAKLLSNEQKTIRFFFIGDGIRKNELQKKCRDMTLANICFLPRQPATSMTTIYNYSDVLVVHLKKNHLFKITIPSKTQAYLSAGKPIVMAVEGDAADLVKQAGAGLACQPDDPSAMANCIRKLCNLSHEERMLFGKKGHSFYKEQLSFMTGVDKMELIFNNTIKSKDYISLKEKK
jgi:glycosyltransferase involved in cell wall biosynthesis